LKRITSNLAFILAVVGVLSFSLIYAALGHDNATNLASILPFGAASIIVVTWATAAYQAVRYNSREGAGILVFGVFLTALGIVENRAYTLVYRWLDRPEWLLTSVLNPLGPWMIFWGLAIILLAPGTVRGNVPWTNIVYIVVAAFLGGMLTAATIFLVLFKTEDVSMRLEEPFKLPVIGAITCSKAQPIRVPAYCRARAGEKLTSSSP